MDIDPFNPHEQVMLRCISRELIRWPFRLPKCGRIPGLRERDAVAAQSPVLVVVPAKHLTALADLPCDEVCDRERVRSSHRCSGLRAKSETIRRCVTAARMNSDVLPGRCSVDDEGGVAGWRRAAEGMRKTPGVERCRLSRGHQSTIVEQASDHATPAAARYDLPTPPSDGLSFLDTLDAQIFAAAESLLPFDRLDLSQRVGALQLMPENGANVLRLELAASIVSTLPAMPDLPSISAGTLAQMAGSSAIHRQHHSIC